MYRTLHKYSVPLCITVHDIMRVITMEAPDIACDGTLVRWRTRTRYITEGAHCTIITHVQCTLYSEASEECRGRCAGLFYSIIK